MGIPGAPPPARRACGESAPLRDGAVPSIHSVASTRALQYSSSTRGTTRPRTSARWSDGRAPRRQLRGNAPRELAEDPEMGPQEPGTLETGSNSRSAVFPRDLRGPRRRDGLERRAELAHGLRLQAVVELAPEGAAPVLHHRDRVHRGDAIHAPPDRARRCRQAAQQQHLQPGLLQGSEGTTVR